MGWAFDDANDKPFAFNNPFGGHLLKVKIPQYDYALSTVEQMI